MFSFSPMSLDNGKTENYFSRPITILGARAAVSAAFPGRRLDRAETSQSLACGTRSIWASCGRGRRSGPTWKRRREGEGPGRWTGRTR
jgi:hypothetical protein